MEKIHNKYKEIFNKFVSLNPEEWNLFKSKLKLNHYKKGEVIQYPNNICTQLSFINYGIVRAYVMDIEGKDYTWNILFNDKNSKINNIYLVDYDSFINKKKSKVGFEVIKECEVLSIQYDDLQTVYQQSKNGEQFGRLMAEQAYSHVNKLLMDKLTKTASERYREFIEETPYLLKKVPQFHIATFLGITPQSLSRIKNNYHM